MMNFRVGKKLKNNWNCFMVLAGLCLFLTGCSNDFVVTQKHSPLTKNTHKDLVAYMQAENWIWPTKGRIVKTFFEGKSASRGIDIVGVLGQPILASVSGKVVYSGTGLHSYGNLIIIKYNENFLTAYGFIKNSLVKEGQIVDRGSKIAEMGTNAKGIAVLHFEVRENGKTVDPLLYLKVR